MAKQHWLVKQEPSAYSWEDFVKQGSTDWTGIRNYQARNNLRAMKRGDEVLFYHSVKEKSVVGWAKVIREHYPDPTAKEGDWSAVDLEPVKPLPHPVSLETIKTHPALRAMALTRHTRLSVLPVTAAQFKRVVELGQKGK